MAKLSFQGAEKTITVLPGVTVLDIRSDLWVEWITWQEANTNWPLALRYSGLDPIPGGESGGIFFLLPGWKLIIDFTETLVIGVLYSDSFNTPYWVDINTPIFPAQVSALVHTISNTVPVQADPALVAQQILASPIDGSTPGSIGEFITKKLLTIAKFIGLK